ncbi:hypothetical protein DB32_002124 [Sandaracinus amylolyticus]|uniref:Uncharacterized protein n=1 Tax=Sandaracinus amylolyticus TaxID=927083 RepID=A0A0F6W1C2_9BACT|nr:hypothetical protein DB32_002124 [Sandaracinus amylolyticus]
MSGSGGRIAARALPRCRDAVVSLWSTSASPRRTRASEAPPPARYRGSAVLIGKDEMARVRSALRRGPGARSSGSAAHSPGLRRAPLRVRLDRGGAGTREARARDGA